MRTSVATKAVFLFLAVLPVAAVAEPNSGAVCDLTVNPEAPDGYFPLPSRFTVVSDADVSETRPTTVMLPDEKTIYAFWDLRHGGPCGPAAVSTDAGRTWTDISDRIPAAFRDAHDTPFAFRFVDPKTGKGRIRVFASYGTATKHSWRGPAERPLAEAMPSILSEDDGRTWRMMPPLGAGFACFNCFSGAARLKDGSYLAVFSRGRDPNGLGAPWSVMSSVSRDGGLTWEKPRLVAEDCGSKCPVEPTLCVSPDGKEVCCLIGNARWGVGRPQVCVSSDGGATWTKPKTASDPLDGSRHMVTTLPDGRYIATFRRERHAWGWIGDYAALRNGTGAGGVQVRLFHGYGDADANDCGNTGVHALKDGTVVVVSHAVYSLSRPLSSIVSMRFTLQEVEDNIRDRETALNDFWHWKPFAKSEYKPLVSGRQYGPFAQALVLKYRPGTKHDDENGIAFGGTAKDLARVAGAKYNAAASDEGVYPVSKFQGDCRGNAAVLVWTVKVAKDCRAKLRFHGSPAFGCWLRGKMLRSVSPSHIFLPVIYDIELKAGENEIMALVTNPTYLFSPPANAKDPLQVAVAISGVAFTCVRQAQELELKADEPSITDDLGEEI